MATIELKVNDKNIIAGTWLTSLNKNQYGENFIELKINNYCDLGFKIKSLLTVCALALENEYTDKESNLEIKNVLDIITNLIPESELELLDQMIDKR